MQVPLFDLKSQHQDFLEDFFSDLKGLMKRCEFIMGPDLKRFERNFAAYFGLPYAIGVASGTDALMMSLDVMGLGEKDDEVIVPAFSFIANADVVLRLGARPVMVDVNAETMTMDPEQVARAINKKTRAIMAVHLFGRAVDMDSLLTLARERGIHVIEDVAQAAGAVYKGKKLGTLGLTGCFSFYPTKNVGGIGDGGMIITNDGELAEALRILRDHGRVDGYVHKYVGYNSRLDSLKAIYLNYKLSDLEETNLERVENVRYYRELLAEVEQARVPEFIEDGSHVYSLLTLEVEQREELQQYLRSQGIATAIYYPVPLHLQPCLEFLGYKEGDFPVSEQLSKRVLTIPNYSGLKRHQLDYVAEKIREFYRRP